MKNIFARFIGVMSALALGALTIPSAFAADAVNIDFSGPIGEVAGDVLTGVLAMLAVALPIGIAVTVAFIGARLAIKAAKVARG